MKELARPEPKLHRPSRKKKEDKPAARDLKRFKFLGLYGFRHRKGGTVVAPKYERLRHFTEGRAAARRKGKWGFINTRGQVILPFEYDSVGDFSRGLAVVHKDDKSWRITATGERHQKRKRKKRKAPKKNPYAHTDWNRLNGWAIRP